MPEHEDDEDEEDEPRPPAGTPQQGAAAVTWALCAPRRDMHLSPLQIHDLDRLEECVRRRAQQAAQLAGPVAGDRERERVNPCAK